MEVTERTSGNGKNSPKHLWLTASRVDPGLKDQVLGGSLHVYQYHFLHLHSAWPVIKSQSIENRNVCST
jgi:hypothetical protein